MPIFNYVALDARGKENRGILDVASQTEALARLKNIGFFPTKVIESSENRKRARDLPGRAPGGRWGALNWSIDIPGLSGRVKPKVLTPFTRQLATVLGAGLPLLRGLRVLADQQKHPAFKRVIHDLEEAIESGSTFSDALALHPKVFPRLYVNMVKAGEIGGSLEIVLARLAEFMEKGQRIRGKVTAALCYPCMVLFVAFAILTALMIWVVPRFKDIFKDMLPGKPLPAFSDFVFSTSSIIAHHFLATFACGLIVSCGLLAFARTRFGRQVVDRCKLSLPAVGDVLRKVAISRFTRTLGTLAGSGVPLLQALTLVRETAGNVLVAHAVAAVHASVKEGETIAAPLAASRIFPSLVTSMVDVGEQTGALPEMLMKIADTYDDEVDHAVTAMTSLLEPILIVFLAVIVGTIVIALFLPLVGLFGGYGDADGDADNPRGFKPMEN